MRGVHGQEEPGRGGQPCGAHHHQYSTGLDPRRKTLSKQECVNGSPDLKQLAINELKNVADLFEGSAPQQTTVPTASASASASAPAPAPASALAPAPAPPPLLQPLVATGSRGHGATGEEATDALRYGAATRQQTGCRYECECPWR